MRGEGGEPVVRAIIAMADGLGLEVTAEGVETEADRERLRELGCPYVQGFLFGRPAAAETAEKLLGAGAWGGRGRSQRAGRDGI